MKRLILFMLACIIIYTVGAAQPITVSNYDSSMPYKNSTLYSFSPTTYSVGVSSSKGAIQNCYVENNQVTGGYSTMGIPLSTYNDNDIHHVNVNLKNGDSYEFFFTTISEFSEDDDFIYGLDRASGSAKVIGLKGNPIYTVIPASVKVDDSEFSIKELSSYCIHDEPNLTHLRTGESVETVNDILHYGSNDSPLNMRPSTFITLICDKAVKNIKYTGILADRVIFLGENQPFINSRYQSPISFVPNNNYTLDRQTVYPNLPNMFESDGIIYVPTDMSERKCDILDWNEQALEIENLVVTESVSYRGIDFKVDNLVYGSLSGLPKLTYLEIGNAGNIEPYALSYCTSLIEANIHNSGNVGDGVLRNSSSLKRVTFSNKGNVGGSVISDTPCESLTYENEGNVESNKYCNAPLVEVVLKNNGYVAQEAFQNITTLKKAVIANSGKLGDYAFAGCTELTDIEIGSVSEVGFAAFKDCSSLQTTSVTGNPQILSPLAFKGCSSLLSINLEDGLKNIGDEAFEGCSSLTDIVIPGTVLTLGFNVFDKCTSLTNLWFNATKFDKNVSPDDASLKTYGNISTQITDDNKEYEYTLKKGETLSGLIYINKTAYDRSPAIKITINGIVVFEESVYDKGDSKRPFMYKATKDETIKLRYSVSNNTTAGTGICNIWSYPECLPNGAIAMMSNFSECPLKSLAIDRQLNYQYYYIRPLSPFMDNTQLESLNIGNDVVELYPQMFKGCSALKNCIIGNGIKEIPEMCFSGCNSLESFTIGSSIEHLGYESFAGCTSIVDFYAYPEVPPTCDTDALTNINKWNCTLHVLPMSLDAYKEADQWKEFFFIQGELISEIDVISEDAYNASYSNSCAGIYTQNGVCISRLYNEEIYSKLPKGIYIVNGKTILKLQ